MVTVVTPTVSLLVVSVSFTEIKCNCNYDTVLFTERIYNMKSKNAIIPPTIISTLL